MGKSERKAERKAEARPMLDQSAPSALSFSWTLFSCCLSYIYFFLITFNAFVLSCLKCELSQRRGFVRISGMKVGNQFRGVFKFCSGEPRKFFISTLVS